MKTTSTSPLNLIVAGLLLCAPVLHAQTILGEFLDASTQTPATAADFTTAGVPGVTSSDTVTAFDIGATFDRNTPVMSGGFTLVDDGFSYDGYNSGPNPVYQQTILDSSAVTISGLSPVLKPGMFYDLYLLTNSVSFTAGNTNTNNSFTYGTQTGADNNVNTVGGKVISFQFNTGRGTPNAVTVSVTGSASDGADYPGISGFAIVSAGAIPEPSTLALLAAGGAMALVVVARRGRKALA